jgi:hypothetical protein
LVPTALPIGFLVVNLIAKALAGEKSFPYAGADMAICGWATYTGVFFRQILAKAIPYDHTLILLILAIFGAFLAWALCIFWEVRNAGAGRV